MADPLGSVASRRIVAETTAILMAHFKRQVESFLKYISSKGIDTWLYEDAQRQRELHMGKSFSEIDYAEKKLSDMKPPTKELESRLKGWLGTTKKEHDKLAKELGKQNIKAANLGGQTALKAMAITGIDFNLQDPRLIKLLMARGAKVANLTAKTTLASFQRKLTFSYYQMGENVATTASAIRSSVQETYKNRAITIARTETAIAQGELNHLTYVENGATHKRWLALKDDRTRASHTKCMEQGVIPINKPYSNGLMHPHDPSGPPEEVINCRCDELAEFSKSDIPDKPWSGGKLSWKTTR